MNTEPGSVSKWVSQMKAGDRSAARSLWGRFYGKLVRAATRRLGRNPDPSLGGEDVAQVAFANVCEGLLTGKYPQLENRDDLWRLLMASMVNRVTSHYRFINAQKRTVALNQPLEKIDEKSLLTLATPEAQAELKDLIEHLLETLDQDDPTGELREIALLYLQEHAASAIAKKMRRRKTNILQKIHLIRLMWEKTLAP
jgi:DNA-directed RNA polymerase specialized sigma24 family protein